MHKITAVFEHRFRFLWSTQYHVIETFSVVRKCNTVIVFERMPSRLDTKLGLQNAASVSNNVCHAVNAIKYGKVLYLPEELLVKQMS